MQQFTAEFLQSGFGLDAFLLGLWASKAIICPPVLTNGKQYSLKTRRFATARRTN
ncbi:MAG: hypothetical protein ACLT0Y_08780 [Christensenellales bacterium]